MTNPVIEEVQRILGIPGMVKLAIALTDEEFSNWEIAKDFDLTIWQVRVCRQWLPKLCNIILKSGRKNATILSFRRNYGRYTSRMQG